MARSSLTAWGVKVSRRIWFVAAAAAVGALLPSMAEAPDLAATSQPAPRAASDESVQIREQLVRADERMAPISREMMTPLGGEGAVERRPIARRRYARNSAESGVMSRARRLLLGDGAVRPEPFPTPR